MNSEEEQFFNGRIIHLASVNPSVAANPDGLLLHYMATKLLAARDTIAERNITIRDANNLEGCGVWYWQGDDEDHPESLTCPILISAVKMRELIAEKDREIAELKEQVNDFSGRKLHKENP